jgi:hypothetical protein
MGATDHGAVPTDSFFPSTRFRVRLLEMDVSWWKTSER